MADEDFHALLRSQGTQKTRLGSDSESRFWLSYRPYESKNVAREWFISPVLTWMHSQDDRVAGITQSGSGGDLLLAGATTRAIAAVCLLASASITGGNQTHRNARRRHDMKLLSPYDSGVSVAELDMTVRGKIVKDASGNLALQAEPNQSFAIAPSELSKNLEPLVDSATVVTMRGQLYKKPAGKKKADASVTLKLLVLEIQKKE